MTDQNPDSKPNPPGADPAAVIRQTAAEQLSAQLTLGTSLIAQCDAWMRKGKPGHVQSATAAARVMQSSAGVARALTLAALGETRHRSIVEQQSPADRQKEARKEYFQNNLNKAETLKGIYKQLDDVVENSVRARMGEKDKEDRIARNLKHYGESVEQLKKVVAEENG